jgi:hypothetical protein
MVQGQTKIRRWVERNLTGPMDSGEWLQISHMTNKQLKSMTSEQALLLIKRPQSTQPQPL